MSTIARRLTIHGHVQGVFYRKWTVRSARDLGLAGWVRNRDDGAVEAHVEGGSGRIDKLIELMRDGPPAAHVDRIDAEIASAQYYSEFEKRD